MPKSKAELMRESRARKAAKHVKCEVYLPNNSDIDENKIKLSRYIKRLGGIYEPKG